jgi:predicted alpha/beta superfamily hydrolase
MRGVIYLKGTVEHFDAGNRRCSVYLPPEHGSGERYPVVYLNGIDELQGVIEATEQHMGKACAPFMLVTIDTVSWNDDMTPWPVPPVTKKGAAFGGRADSYLDTLATEVKLFVDARYRTKPEPENTALAGYSLGGLTALYALYTQTAFGLIGSLSGSLWYDGWLGYMAAHRPANAGARVYLSLGTKEPESKNPRMAAVGSCTEKAAEILGEQLGDASRLRFEWNDGGHFYEIPQRFRRALLWLMRME